VTEDDLPDPPRYYANQVQPVSSRFDLTLKFGRLALAGEGREWLVGVTMAWEEAKILESILAQTLAQYEQLVGGIRDVENVDAGLGDLSQNGGGTARPDQETDSESDPDKGSDT
jgi:hypothetical protein